ncbi:MAG: transcription termination factor NusA [Chloroflexota bacterium]
MATQSPPTNEFALALVALKEKHGLPPAVLLRAVEEALAAGYRREYNPPYPIAVHIDPEKGQQRLCAVKQVVLRVRDEGREITLLAARRTFPEAQEHDEVEVVLPLPESWGRISALAFKQIVQQKIRDAEQANTYDRFADLEGELVSGIVTRVDEGTLFVGLGGAEGEMPPSEQIPSEQYKVGQRLQAYLTKVQRSVRGTHLILSRTDRGLLRRLFELEVPEIHAGTVEIKSIAREPGSRSKIAVASRQEGIDPVGACIGVRRVRIQNIVNELGGEKVDIIVWQSEPGAYVASALSPATVCGTEVRDTEKKVVVTVPANQLSLAIGKEGQNARLASRLTGWRIDIHAQAVPEDDPAADTGLALFDPSPAIAGKE